MKPDVSHRLVLFHTMDPRGKKLGGIETHVRLVLAKHPAATSILFVGIDEIGDCSLGEVMPLTFEDRSIDFMPVARVTADRINRAAKTLTQSTTFRFALGALRYLRAIRASFEKGVVSSEIERFEFAIVPTLLRLPMILIVHNEGTKEDKMDSLLKRFWFLHVFNERIALSLAHRIFAVNPSIATRIAALSRTFGQKTEVMSVSVDTERFRSAPFPRSDDALHICFAGRLDDFKDPPLMFDSVANLASALARQSVGGFKCVIFDYVGASDPNRFSQFAKIAGITVRHGIRDPASVARIMRDCHVGIITSFFEGMPCYLLEMIASGRPVVAIDLPQFRNLIVSGLSGHLVARQSEAAASASAISRALLAVAAAIDAGAYDHAAIAALAQPFSVKSQMTRLFAAHEQVARSIRPVSVDG